MELNEEVIRKAKVHYSNLKENGCNYIINCTNNKTQKEMLNNLEGIERIGMRGIYLTKTVRANGFPEILGGYYVGKKVVENHIIPMCRRHNLNNGMINYLEHIIPNKYVNGFRVNLTKLFLNVYFKGSDYLKRNNKCSGYQEAFSLQQEICGMVGILMNNKCIAYENSLYRKNKRRLKAKLDN